MLSWSDADENGDNNDNTPRVTLSKATLPVFGEVTLHSNDMQTVYLPPFPSLETIYTYQVNPPPELCSVRTQLLKRFFFFFPWRGEGWESANFATHSP